MFTVRVAGPGKTAWRVTVRADDPAAARAVLSARGHTVLGVEAGRLPRPRPRRRPPKACSNCAYDLRGLPAGDCFEVVCPECGVTNLPPAWPRTDWNDRARRWSMFALLTKTLIIVVITAVVLLWLLR